MSLESELREDAERERRRAERAEKRLVSLTSAAWAVIQSCGDSWGVTPPTVTSLADLEDALNDAGRKEA